MPNRFILETNDITGIPVLTLACEGLQRAPVVFYFHGYTGNKADELELFYMLAKHEFFVVSIDAKWHGGRFDPKQRQFWNAHPEAIYPIEAGLDTYVMLLTKIVPQMARDVSTLIDHFSDDPRVDQNRIGVSGASMGGFATFLAAASEPRITAAAPLIAYPGFSLMWQQYTTEAASYEKWHKAMQAARPAMDQHTQLIGQIDPFDKIQAFAPKPLLIVQGDQDTHSPKHTSVALYQSLLPLYADHPERLRLGIHDGVDHRVTREMREEVTAWFVRWLLE